MADSDGKSRTIYSNPGSKTKSAVWKHFGFYKVKEDLPPPKNNLQLDVAVCRLCHKTYKNTGNTTNFHIHINTAHTLAASGECEIHPSAESKTEKRVKRPSQQTLSSMINSGGKISQERKKKLDDLLLKLLVGKVLPPSLVENQHFRDFIQEMEPRYVLPTRKKVMDILSLTQQEITDKIKDEIKTTTGLGLTHDGWTSINTESYNTTTIHYINQKWEMKSAVLNTKKLEGSHTSEKLAETLLETKVIWGLPDVVATTDNAANEVKAFRLLDWPRFGCYGHRINLVVKHALEVPEVSKILGKARKLVTLFHTSSSVMDNLREKQILLLDEKLQGHKLIADVPTRWNSTLAMLERINEQTPALSAVARDEKLSKTARTTLHNTIFSFYETSVVEKLVDLLQPFKKATENVYREIPIYHKSFANHCEVVQCF